MPREPRLRDYLTRDEVASLLRTAKKGPRHGARNHAIILLAYRHGLRLRARQSSRERPRSRYRDDLLPPRKGFALEPASDEAGRRSPRCTGIAWSQVAGD